MGGREGGREGEEDRGKREYVSIGDEQNFRCIFDIDINNNILQPTTQEAQPFTIHAYTIMICT